MVASVVGVATGAPRGAAPRAAAAPCARGAGMMAGIDHPPHGPAMHIANPMYDAIFKLKFRGSFLWKIGCNLLNDMEKWPCTCQDVGV